MFVACLSLRGLPEEVPKGEILKELTQFGKVLRVKRALDGSTFVEFKYKQDATAAMQAHLRRPLLGAYRASIEYIYPQKRYPTPTGSLDKNPRYPVFVYNISPQASWRELKSFGRKAGGRVVFCDIDQVRRDRGYIEYATPREAGDAVEYLNGRRLLGLIVEVCPHQPLKQRHSEVARQSRDPDTLSMASPHRVARPRSRSPPRRSRRLDSSRSSDGLRLSPLSRPHGASRADISSSHNATNQCCHSPKSVTSSSSHIWRSSSTRPLRASISISSTAKRIDTDQQSTRGALLPVRDVNTAADSAAQSVISMLGMGSPSVQLYAIACDLQEGLVRFPALCDGRHGAPNPAWTMANPGFVFLPAFAPQQKADVWSITSPVKK